MVWASLPILPGFYPKWVSPPILQLCSCRLYDLPVLPKVLMFGTIKAATEMVVSGSSDFIGFGVQVAPRPCGLDVIRVLGSHFQPQDPGPNSEAASSPLTRT